MGGWAGKKEMGGWVSGWAPPYLISHAHITILQSTHDNNLIHIGQEEGGWVGLPDE